jgi:hypothetical protein
MTDRVQPASAGFAVLAAAVMKIDIVLWNI